MPFFCLPSQLTDKKSILDVMRNLNKIVMIFLIAK